MRLADAVSYASTAPIRLDKKDNVVHLDATINGVHNYKGLRAHLAPVMCSATRAVGGGYAELAGTALQTSKITSFSKSGTLTEQNRLL